MRAGDPQRQGGRTALGPMSPTARSTASPRTTAASPTNPKSAAIRTSGRRRTGFPACKRCCRCSISEARLRGLGWEHIAASHRDHAGRALASGPPQRRDHDRRRRRFRAGRPEARWTVTNEDFCIRTNGRRSPATSFRAGWFGPSCAAKRFTGSTPTSGCSSNRDSANFCPRRLNA